VTISFFIVLRHFQLPPEVNKRNLKIQICPFQAKLPGKIVSLVAKKIRDLPEVKTAA
jgi:hypothetical protein